MHLGTRVGVRRRRGRAVALAEHLPPRNKGLRYPADPPTVEEIVAVMRAAGDRMHGRRLRGPVVVLWRARLGIDEALALGEPDLDRRRGSLLGRRGKGGRPRNVGMDDYPATPAPDRQRRDAPTPFASLGDGCCHRDRS
jgi:integrase